MFWRRVGWCGLRRLHIHAAHSTHRDLEVALHQCIEEIQATSTNASQSACWFVYAGKGYSGNTLYQLPNMFGKICSNASMLGGVVDAVGGHTQAITVVRFMPNASSVQPFYIPAAHLPPRRAKSVGRWPSSIGSFTAPVGAGPGAIVDTPWHLNDFQSVTRAPIVDCLPSVLKDKPSPDMVWLTSDTEPYAFIEAMQASFPNTCISGMIAASTPFVTGQPFTLYFNGKTWKDGIAGVTIHHLNQQLSIDLKFRDLVPMGPAMRITKCRGNVIVDLDGKAATSALLQQIRIQQSTEYYLGIYDMVYDDYKPEMARVLARVMSGDPSRGHLAIDSLCDLMDGDMVQFFIRTTSEKQCSSFGKVQFEVMPSDEAYTTLSPLCVASEHGLIVSNRKTNHSKETWVCTVPLARLSLVSH